MTAGALDARSTVDALIASARDGSPLAGIDASEPSLIALGDEVERRAVADAGAAVVAGRALVALTDDHGGARTRARARRALAQALAYSGQIATALDTAAAAAAIAAAGGEAVEAARARIASIHPLAALGRFDAAIAAGVEARDTLLAIGEAELAARAELNLGAVSAMRDDLPGALAWFDRARPAFAEQPAILAQLETNRGNVLTALGDFSAAGAALAEAVAAFERAGQPLAAAIAEGNRGHLAARQGRPQAALASFERARRLLDAVEGRAHRARLLAEQAEVLVQLGLPAQAAAILDDVLLDLTDAGLRAEVARAHAVRGRAAAALGNHAAARAAFARAVDDLTALDLPVERARVDVHLARLAEQSGDPGQAARLAADALATLQERPVDRVVASLALGHALLAAGDAANAEPAIDAARADVTALGLAPLLAEALLLRGRIERAAGRPAFASFAAAVDEVERVRGSLQAESLRAAFHADRLAPYAELAREALARGDLATAFRAIEQAKSRSLLDLVGGLADSPPDDGDPLAADLAERRAELNWRYSRFATGEDGGAPSSLRALELAVQGLEVRLAATRTAAHPASPPVSLDEAIATLATDEALLLYAALDDELVALVLSPSGCRAYRGLASLTDVAEGLRRFKLQVARALARPRSTERLVADANRELAALWRLLLEPVAPPLDAAVRLTIVPHGPLHAVPFGALTDGSRALIDRHELHTLPSASLRVRLGAVAPAPSDAPAVVFGVPDALAPTIADEVADVGRVLPGARLHLGGGATADRFLAIAPGARLLHLACHGRYLRELPHASGLKLADRWLTTAEIAGCKLAGAHVTLSACDTGRAAVAAGDELIGLARAFYAAGARSLVYSLWPVHDESTARVMAAMYRNAAPRPSARSLRTAQLALKERFPHPAYWAAFAYGGV